MSARDAFYKSPTCRAPASSLRKQLGNAVDATMASLESLPVDSLDWAIRFRVESRTRTVADIAQALAQEALASNLNC